MGSLMQRKAIKVDMFALEGLKGDIDSLVHDSFV